MATVIAVRVSAELHFPRAFEKTRDTEHTLLVCEQVGLAISLSSL